MGIISIFDFIGFGKEMESGDHETTSFHAFYADDR